MYIGLHELDIDDLLLDTENPRIPRKLHVSVSEGLRAVEAAQTDCLVFLAKTSAIEELVSAISENGYFAGEPLIGIPIDDRILIVEGNRRLTSLKLLKEGVPEQLGSRLKILVEDAKTRPQKIPVFVYATRPEVLNYLGNRHIAGVKSWGALAKARYVNQLFEATPGTDFDSRCTSVAKVIGSRRDFISRTLRAFELFKVAEEDDFFGLDLSEESVRFSLLTTAVDYSGIQSFIYDKDESLLNAPLKELLSWMFVPREGDKKPPLGDSRKIGDLSKVLASKESLAAFRGGATLRAAYLKSEGVNEDFDVSLMKALERVREANSTVAEVDPIEERVENARRLFKQTKSLRDVLQSAADE